MDNTANNMNILKNTSYPVGIFNNSLNLLQGNTLCNDLIGNNLFLSLYMFTSAKDHMALERAVQRLTSRKSNTETLSVDLLLGDGSGRKNRLTLWIERYNDLDFIISFHDLKEEKSIISKLSQERSILREYLSLSSSILFKYTIATDEFLLYWINHENNILLYSMPLTEWEKNVIENGYIEGENDRRVFADFINSLRNHYMGDFKFSSKITSKGGDLVFDTIKMIPIQNNNAIEFMLGIWNTSTSADSSSSSEALRAATIDPLTGILNKKTITDYARKAIEHGEGHNIAIAILDLDYFKNVNDTFGHMFGDKVLIAAADIIKSAAGEKAVCGRMGGDEFMIVINDFEDAIELRNILRCIKSNIPTIYKETLTEINLSCSIGLSRFPRDTQNFDDMFRIADKCLYLAKQKGRNRYIMFEPEKHAQFFEKKESSDMMEIKNAFYSEKDLYSIHNMMRDYIIHGRPRLTSLLHKLSDTMLFDRISIYWNGRIYKEFSNSFASDSSPLPPNFIDEAERDKYFQFFSNDIMITNNTRSFEVKAPKTYAALENSKVMTLFQFILRDENGKQCGLVSAEGCQNYFTIPTQTCRLMAEFAEILNAVLIRDKQ